MIEKTLAWNNAGGDLWGKNVLEIILFGK